MAYKNKTLTNKFSGQSFKFLQTAADTRGRLLEIETSWQPFAKEPPPHYHPCQEEDFVVISGELTVRINGHKKVLKQGERLHVAKRMVHSMWNDSAETTIVNWKVCPALDTENFLEMGIGLANDGKLNKKGMPHILQISLMANKFSKVFRLSSPPFFVQRVLFMLLTPVAYLAGYNAVYKKYID
jgi:quercetin dioxygenase-like cupin family protein